MSGFRTALVDPPWRYNAGAGRRGASDKHYDTMSLYDLCGYREHIDSYLERDAHLWMWTTNPMLLDQSAFTLLAAWGFTAHSMVTWVKARQETAVSSREEKYALFLESRKLLREADTKTSGAQVIDKLAEKTAKLRVHIGMGRYTRGATEHLILATRGKIRVDPPAVAIPNVLVAWPTRHSAKPPEQYHLVETISPGPYIEFFARNERDGWSSDGIALD